MSIDPENLRLVMRSWATGVTIVSSFFGGIRHGMTVNSFTSISLDPPLVLVSLERVTKTCRLVEQAGFFGVSLLAQEQEEISERFAGRHSENSDRFAGLESFSLVSAAPLLSDCLAVLDCQVVATYEAGTHTLFIGEVLAGQNLSERVPLVYFNRAYRGLSV